MGNDYNRREFIVLGESIDQVTKACDAAKYGELMASPEANDILQRRKRSSMNMLGSSRNVLGSSRSLRGQDKDKDNKRNKKSKNNNNNKSEAASAPLQKQQQPVLIASGKETYFEKATQTTHHSRDISIPFDKIDATSLQHLQKLLSLYVHPVVLSDHTGMRNSQRNARAIQERHRSEAEIRSVYTLFIKPIVKTEITDNIEQNKELYLLLDDILDVTTSVLDGYKGHLRQFIVDDKGKYFHLFAVHRQHMLIV